MHPDDRFRIVPGTLVVGSDNRTIGRVVDTAQEDIRVETEDGFPDNVYLPTSEVVQIDADRIHLRLTRDEALTLGWDRDGIGPSETVRIPIFGEEVSAFTRDVVRGAILIEKEIVTEMRTITVPVREERLRVTRVPAGTPGSVGIEAFENGPLEIPIWGQEVDVQTVVRAIGELVIEKQRVQEIRRYDATVRREEVRVDEPPLAVDDDPDRS